MLSVFVFFGEEESERSNMCMKLFTRTILRLFKRKSNGAVVNGSTWGIINGEYVTFTEEEREWRRSHGVL